MKTHTQLFKAGKMVEAYLAFKKEQKKLNWHSGVGCWSFETYINKMKLHHDKATV